MALPVTTQGVIEKTVKYLDFETLEPKSEKISVPFSPATDLQAAYAAIGNDQERILKAINQMLLKDAVRGAKATVASKGINKSVLMKTIANFRLLPPYDSMEDRKAQTKALFDLVLSTPPIFNAVKAASLKAAETDDESSDEDSDE